MKIFTILRQSITSIMSNKVRSFLTVLGIIIGIGSVIGLMSLGNGVRDSISAQIGSLGSKNITITSGGGALSRASNFSTDSSTRQNQSATAMSGSDTLTSSDLEALLNINDGLIKYVAGSVSTSEIVKVGDVEQRHTILGVSSQYYDIYELVLSSGEYPIGTTLPEVVLGSTLAKDLFGEGNPIQQNIMIQDTEFKVVGILSESNGNGFTDPNSQAYILDSEAFKFTGSEYYKNLVVQTYNESDVDQVKQDVENTLLTSHKIDDKSLEDFTIMTSKDLLATVDQITGMLTSFLAGIAGISLLVGGIGIMNIMLVSVTERTREVGLRKALGAKISDILFQFVTEAVILTLIGGIIGIIFGFLLGYFIGNALGITSSITTGSILLAVGISSFIGIAFGIYPAMRAAKLNPIDALRYE